MDSNDSGYKSCGDDEEGCPGKAMEDMMRRGLVGMLGNKLLTLLGQHKQNTTTPLSAIPLHHGELSTVWHPITRQPSLRCHVSSTEQIRLGPVENIHQEAPRFNAAECGLAGIQRKGKRACVDERDWRSCQGKDVGYALYDSSEARERN